MTYAQALRILWIVGLAGGLASIGAPILSLRLQSFQGDEATYYMMAQSLALDGDLRYTRADLYRVYRDFPDGPQGLFLRAGRDGDLFYAKSFIYSLWVAPFFRILGVNSFVFVNVVLLWVVWILGFRWAHALGWTPGRALLWSFAFIGLSVVPAYAVWLKPEIFNFATVFIALFFLWYPDLRPIEGPARRWWDWVGAVVAGMGTFSKPVIGAVFVVATGTLLLRRQWGRWIRWAGGGGLVALALFGLYWWNVGDWNYMGGLRKTFYGHFPLETPQLTFERVGIYHSADITYEQEYYIDARTVVQDFFYYFVGRYAGVAWYFTPALVGLGMALRWPQARSIWLLVGFGLMVAAFIVSQPHNYLGGGGTIANRYFLCAYPWTFFMASTLPRVRTLVLMVTVAAIFSLPIVTDPFLTARSPWRYATGPFHAWLPLEYTQLENLPSNTYPHGFNVPFPDPGRPDYFAFFLNDAFYPREGPGLWVRGGQTLRMVLKRHQPFAGVRIHLRNGPIPDHRIRVRFGPTWFRLRLHSREHRTIELAAPRGYRVRNVWMWPVEVSAQSGFVPAFEEPGNRDRRYLGVFVVIEPWTPPSAGRGGGPP
ncbi:MAG: hypothetical protein NZ742_00805 [Acidobacteria bacterium]|nr:hypothetical protein [Acidobacteriota bacterium]MDW7983368.1 hypothetical protein [Acidobacteriota bacterium]